MPRLKYLHQNDTLRFEFVGLSETSDDALQEQLKKAYTGKNGLLSLSERNRLAKHLNPTSTPIGTSKEG